jgi:hypothetical protein
MWNHRREPPLNLICLGSDFNPYIQDEGASTMQGARFESGLDNRCGGIGCNQGV